MRRICVDKTAALCYNKTKIFLGGNNMNLILKRAAAVLLSAAVLSGGTAMPAAAAEKTAEPVDVKTVCAGYEPLSDDLMYITLTAAVPVRAELIQHSPERDPLPLYDSTLTGSTAGTKYRYAVERGDYTLRLTYSPVTASKSNDRTVEYKFTMENADYSKEPNAFTHTDMEITVSGKACKATEALAPAAGKPADTVKDGIKTQTLSVRLDYYTGGRGDYNGDGLTDVSDAQLVLRAYVARVAGTVSENAPNAMQSTLCDINGDGEVSVDDAQYILKFYTATVAGLEPVWPDGVKDPRYTEKAAS